MVFWWGKKKEKDVFNVELKNCKSQKLSEGVKWDVEQVALLESVRMNLGERSIDEFRFTILSLRFAWNTLTTFSEAELGQREGSYISLRVKPEQAAAGIYSAKTKTEVSWTLEF